MTNLGLAVVNQKLSFPRPGMNMDAYTQILLQMHNERYNWQLGNDD